MMKINRRVLEGALERVFPFVDGKPAIPVLKGILFTPKDNTLTLMGSNKSNTSLTTVEAISNDLDKAFCIDGKWITDYAKKITGEDIEISLEGNNVTLKSSSSIVNYPLIEAADFPKFPVATGEVVLIKAEDFKKLIRHTTIAATADDTLRPILACIHLEIAKDGDKSKVVAVSLDGHRMAVFSTGVECSDDAQSKANVNAAALGTVAKSLNGEEKCKLTFSDKMLFIELEHCKYALELDTGSFINYQSIIPSSFSTIVKLKKGELLEKLNILELVKGDKAVVSQFNVTAKKVMEVSASGSGSIKDEIAILDLNGGAIKVMVQNEYIIECLKVMDGEECTINMLDKKSPIIISPSGLYEYLYMVLPLVK